MKPTSSQYSGVLHIASRITLSKLPSKSEVQTNREMQPKSAQEDLKRANRMHTANLYIYRFHVVVVAVVVSHKHKRHCVAYTKVHIDAIDAVSDIDAPPPF